MLFGDALAWQFPPHYQPPLHYPAAQYTAGPGLLLSRQGTRVIVGHRYGLQHWRRARAVCLRAYSLSNTGLMTKKKELAKGKRRYRVPLSMPSDLPA